MPPPVEYHLRPTVILDQFRQPPAPLSGRERLLLISTAVAVAVTRVIARTRSPWDWDEALFQLGVRDYDVTRHHPHPPGYPMYIAMAKFVRLFVHSDFHALQIVVISFAVLLFPAVFFLARELRFDVRTSMLGALIVCFLPSVWYYGGTAFSDIPGVVSGIAACVLLLRGCRDPRAYVAGAVLLGLSAGIRPQNLLTAFIPALLSTIIRLRVSIRTVIAAAIAGAIALGGCYAGAALASGSVAGYRKIMRIQEKYVHDIDSYHNPGRASLRDVAERTFLRPGGEQRRSIAIIVLCAASLIGSVVQRRVSPLLMVLMFLPFAVFAWIMLSPEAMPRYATGYLVMYGLLAADGLRVLSGLLPRGGALVHVAAMLALTLALARWTWPAIARTRKNLSPTAAAISFLRAHAQPHRSTIFIHSGLSPYGEHDLADYQPVYFENQSEIPEGGFPLPAFIFTPEPGQPDGAEIFSLPHDQLWDIVRRRNFEVSVVPMWARLRFGRGWYGTEGEGTNTWRWMAKQAEIDLPPVPSRGRLSIEGHVPVDIEPTPPVLELRVNGVVVDRLVCTTGDLRKEWILTSRRDAWNDVELTMSEAPVPAAVHAGDDARELGFQLSHVRWEPAP